MDIGAQQTEVRRLAYWDRLTGLPNRERFREAVVQAIAASASTPQPLAVLTLDLDRFKHVTMCWAMPLATACCRPWPSA